MKRYQINKILSDLNKKMVFIIGPRQIGKTWLSKEILTAYSDSIYLNYDNYDDREVIHAQSWRNNTTLIVFDELHKMPLWKNYIKGVYDKKLSHQNIIVTGSARLDTFRSMGDSLTGRYYKHRLLPLSLKELSLVGESPNISRLLERGGYPEPYISETDEDATRWRSLYVEGLISEEILDFSNISQLTTMKTLIKLLRKRVGSQLSYQSLANDLNTSSITIKKYIDILEALFIIFRIYPYSKNIARSILKEPKYYFYDTGLVEGPLGIKFENLLAISLLKHCYGLQDYKGETIDLMYIRTKEKKEVDFCLVQDEQPIQLIEAKQSDMNFSTNLVYFSKKYNIKGVQVVLNMTHKPERQLNNLEMRHAESFLLELFI